MTTDQKPAHQTRAETGEVVALIPALRAFARTFCREPYDADDLVQETLLKAISKIDQFESGTRLKSWLFTIMRNSFYNRAVVAAREAPGGFDCVSSVPSCASTQEWRMRAIDLGNAINRMPEAQRETLLMVTLMGKSYEEAAELCDCDIGTVKSRVNRSRARLCEELGDEAGSVLRI